MMYIAHATIAIRAVSHFYALNLRVAKMCSIIDSIFSGTENILSMVVWSTIISAFDSAATMDGRTAKPLQYGCRLS